MNSKTNFKRCYSEMVLDNYIDKQKSYDNKLYNITISNELENIITDIENIKNDVESLVSSYEFILQNIKSGRKCS
jgi:hypothetical protein